MYVASIPFFPTDKRTYDIEDLRPNEQIMMELYPEIYSCIGCNACTKACPAEVKCYAVYCLCAERRFREMREGIL
ncbi:MAG: 4Fe-4S dicluster domain-containing protein [Clostridium sp.]